MALIAQLIVTLLFFIASITTGLPTIDVGAANILYPTALRPVEFKGKEGTTFNKDTPLGGHAEGLSNVFNGPSSPLSLFGKNKDGKLNFKAPTKKKKKKPSPSPTPTPTQTPTPSPSAKPKPKNFQKKKSTHKKNTTAKKKSTISSAELKRLKEEAIRREHKRHKEELEREKKKYEELVKKKQKNKPKKKKSSPSKKKKTKGGRDYKCTPGKKICAQGFWCVGEKGDMVCRRPKAPYESCRGVKERCQIGSVCKKGSCVVKYKKKADKAEKARHKIFEPKAASTFKRKTASDILGH